MSADNFDIVERNRISFSTSNNSFNDLLFDIRDGNSSSASKPSIQLDGINRDGTTPVLIDTDTPENAFSSNNKSADTLVDRGAWIVFCVTRCA